MFTIAIVSTTLCLPFMIADIVYALGDSDCVTRPIIKQPSMSMQVWLMSNSIISMVFAIIILAIVFKIHIRQHKTQHLIFSYLLSWLLYSLFRLCWTIVGSTIFWDTLYPSKLCDRDHSAYIISTLLCGFLIAAVGFYASSQNMQLST